MILSTGREEERKRGREEERKRGREEERKRGREEERKRGREEERKRGREEERKRGREEERKRGREEERKNPDLTPLNGLDDGFKADNKGYTLRPFGLWAAPHSAAPTSCNPGTLAEMPPQRGRHPDLRPTGY